MRPHTTKSGEQILILEQDELANVLFWLLREVRKLSKIKAVRSMTFNSRSTDFPDLIAVMVLTRHRKMIKSAPVDLAKTEISSTLPPPTKVLGFGESSFCVVTATVSALAVSANRSSSAKEDEVFQRMPGRSTPTSTAFRFFQQLFSHLIKTD